MSPLPPEVETSKDKFPQQSLLQPPLQEQNRQAPSVGVGKQDGVVSPLPLEVETSKYQLHHVQGPEHLRPLNDGVRSPLPPEVEDNRDADSQDKFAQQSLLQPPLQEQNRQAPSVGVGKQVGVVSPLPPEVETSKDQPHHVQGQEHLRPLHDGAESLIPPELGDGNQDGQLLLAPIPIQTSKKSSRQEHVMEE